MGLQGGGCRLITLGSISVSIQFRNNFNLPGSPAFIVGIDDLLEAVHTEDAGVGLLKIENEDLPPYRLGLGSWPARQVHLLGNYPFRRVLYLGSFRRALHPR